MRLKSSDRPDWRSLRRSPTHPGALVKEHVLEAYGLTQQELADALGLSRLSVNEIVNEKRNITESTALRLEKLTGVSAEFWLDLQRNYSLWHASIDEAKYLEKLKPLTMKLR